MQQLEEQVFHVFADVPGLGQRGGIADGKRHVQDARQGAGQQRLAAAGRPEQQDVRFVDLDVRALGAEHQPLVVAVDGHGQHFFGVLLADHVFVQLRDDFPRRGHLSEKLLIGAAAAPLLLEDRLAQFDALAADIDVAWPFDQGTNVSIALATK